MNWDERGRLWVCETVDYPNELAAGRARAATAFVICEDTDGDGRADKFTVFADKLSIPTSFTFCQRRRRSSQHGTADAVPQGHQRRRQGRRAQGAVQRLEHAATPTAASATFATAWTTGSAACRATTTSQRRPVGGEDAQRSARASSASSRADGAISELEFLRSTNNNTWGLGISEEGSSSARRPTATRASTCRSPTATTSRSAAGRRSVLAEHRRQQPVPADHRQGPPGRLARRLHRRPPGTRSTPPATTRRNTGTAPRSSREPTGHLVAHVRARREGQRLQDRQLRGTCWPATTNGPRRSWPRSGPTATSGSSTGTTTSSSTTPRRRLQDRQGRTPTRRELRDKKHGRIYRIVYEGRRTADWPTSRFSLKDATPEKLVADAEERQPVLAAARPAAAGRAGQAGRRAGAGRSWSKDPSVDAIGLNAGAIHALWTLHGLGPSTPPQRADAVDGRRSRRSSIRRPASAATPCRSAGPIARVDASMRCVESRLLRRRRPAGAAGGPAARWPIRPTRAGAAAVVRCSPCRENPRRPLASRRRHRGRGASTTAVPAMALAVAQKHSPVRRELLDATRIVAEHYARGGAERTVGDVVADAGRRRPAAVDRADHRAASQAAGRRTAAQLAPSEPTRSCRAADDCLASERAGAVQSGLAPGAAQRSRADCAEIAEPPAGRLPTTRSCAEPAASTPPSSSSTSAKRTPRPLGDVARPDHARDVARAGRGLLEAARAERVAARSAPAIVERLADADARVAARPRFALLLEPGRLDDGACSTASRRARCQLGDLSLDQKQALADHPDRRLAAPGQGAARRGGGLPNPDRQKVLDELLPLTKKEGRRRPRASSSSRSSAPSATRTAARGPRSAPT